MLNYGTAQVNGQMVPIRTMDAYAPRAYGPTRMSAPGSPNTVPPMLGVGGGIGAIPAGPQSGVSGGADGALTTAGVSSPWSWVVSPVPIAVLSLVVALIWLRAIHW